MRTAFAVAALAAAAFLSTPVAQASLLSSDPLALAAWQGTQTFYATDATYTLNVTVDYAVYEPGQYPGADPSGGEDYVYAYEVFNTLNSESVEVSILTVGLDTGSSARNPGSTSGPPGQLDGTDPTQSKIGTTSARWYFLLDTVDYTEDSATLIFTSPYRPQWRTGSVADGGLSADAPLPSPMPEPATLGFLGAGLAVAFAMHRRRRLNN